MADGRRPVSWVGRPSVTVFDSCVVATCCCGWLRCSMVRTRRKDHAECCGRPMGSLSICRTSRRQRCVFRINAVFVQLVTWGCYMHRYRSMMAQCAIHNMRKGQRQRAGGRSCKRNPYMNGSVRLISVTGIGLFTAQGVMLRCVCRAKPHPHPFWSPRQELGVVELPNRPPALSCFHSRRVFLPTPSHRSPPRVSLQCFLVLQRVHVERAPV